MSDIEPKIMQNILLEAVEYLLDVRQVQLGESLREASHQGDREWTHRLRDEVDRANRLLQLLREYKENS